MKTLKFDQAVSLKLANYQRPVITAYELGKLVYWLIKNGNVDNTPLQLKVEVAQRRHYLQALRFLKSYGLLKEIRGVAADTLFALPGNDQKTPAEQIVCYADPFAYISHMSAMEFYGFTDRIPQNVFSSSPKGAEWRQEANKRMERDLGEDLPAFVESGLPVLARPRFSKIRNRQINVLERKHLGAFRTIRSTGMRVSTIGRTFLDMLRDPDLCGGIRHVLSVYQEHAKDHQKLILDDVDQHGTAIDKVRTGYVLEELLNIQDPIIEGWKPLAQRGGSRKLYAAGEYSPTFSATWCLSINTDL